jgi:hypothetical protein
MRASRRKFLVAGAATAIAAGAAPFVLRSAKPRYTGGIVGGNSVLGHAMRDGKLPPSVENAEVEVVIVGGGIAGLAAARRLKRDGLNNFMLLELESQPGGNATSGQNTVSAYPWGAHYVPLAGSDAPEITQLFEELSVITGRNTAGLPIYNEEYLCADPMERLFLNGRWQEGLVPQLGLSASEQRTIESFLAEMNALKAARGSDGKRAFTIPVDESSRDEAFRQLDRITMAEYLRSRGWLDCVPLRWYVNYCCRDDYGAGIDQISAWAGVHYFASRDAQAANAPSYAVVTWPEGNGWLVRQMRSPLATNIRTSCAVWNVEAKDAGFAVGYYDLARDRSVRVQAKGVIWAAPRFVAQRAVRALREPSLDSSSITYSPWMVANLTSNTLPEGLGASLAWDNVIYDNDSLGYVVATHQNLHPFPKRTVITYYQPLDSEEPVAARRLALEQTYDQWCRQIFANLNTAHPDLEKHTSHLDVWLWGHAMVRPVPGFIWGDTRQKMLQPMGNLLFAHSDMSGISIFEEAYIHGVRAGDSLLKRLGHSASRV